MKENSAESRPWYGGRGAVIQTLRKKAARSPKEFFSALWASLWSKNKGGGGAGSLGPTPGSATGFRCSDVWLVCEFFLSSFVTVMRQDWLKLTTNPSLATHPTKLTTLLGSILSSSRKDVGCSASYQMSFLHKCWALETRQINGFRLYQRIVLCRRKN